MIVPSQAEINAAWIRLPAAERDRIGFIAVDMVFAGFVFGDVYVVAGRPEDRAVLDEATRDAAAETEQRRLNDLTTAIEAALPDLFGPEGENPAWSENAGPVPTAAALAAVAVEAAAKADHARRARSLRARLGRRGLRLYPSHGAYVIADRGSGIPKTDILSLDAAEAWLAGGGQR